MSEKIRLLYYALWIAHPVLQAVIAGLMFWRRLHRKFPFFFGYILTQLRHLCRGFPASCTTTTAPDFYLYWATKRSASLSDLE